MTDDALSGPAVSTNGRHDADYYADVLLEREEQLSRRRGRGSGLDWGRITRAWVVPSLILIESLLAFRLGFLLVSADPLNGFVSFVYEVTRPLVSPFEGVIKPSTLGDTGVFEPSILVAMLAYLVGALLLTSLANAIAATVEETRRSYALREDEASQEARAIRP
jgi:hypothetical protein